MENQAVRERGNWMVEMEKRNKTKERKNEFETQKPLMSENACLQIDPFRPNHCHRN